MTAGAIARLAQIAIGAVLQRANLESAGATCADGDVHFGLGVVFVFFVDFGWI
jgi:hypothetical protein